MRSLLKAYFNKVMANLSEEDLQVIKGNLEMLEDSMLETILLNRYRYVWIDVDRFCSAMRRNIKDMIRISNITGYVNSDIDRSMCFGLHIDSTGRIEFEVSFEYETIRYTNEKNIDTYIKNGYWDWSPRSERSDNYNIPFRYVEKTRKVFRIENDDAKNFMLKLSTTSNKPKVLNEDIF